MVSLNAVPVLAPSGGERVASGAARSRPPSWAQRACLLPLLPRGAAPARTVGPAERLADGLPGLQRYRVGLTLDNVGPHAGKGAAHAVPIALCDDLA